MSDYTLSIASKLTPNDVNRVGGKGYNLSLMMNAHLPIPHGFLITTKGYDDFVSTDMQDWINQKLDEEISVDEKTKEIRDKFTNTTIADELKAAITNAYHNMGDGLVSVRSSATCEDSPDFSFAGQQDTILNVTGADNVLEAVITCWSSLWTARSIEYRTRNSIGDASMGVVVQRMVRSMVSGVCFTADPVSGSRNNVVIDGSLGLGEALVSGLVEPDHWRVDVSDTPVIAERFVGAKATRIMPKEGGGTETVESSEDDAKPCLTDGQILNLTRVALKCSNLECYKVPLDTEWAIDNYGILWLLQARPITTLFPVPHIPTGRGIHTLFNLAVVQGWNGSYTPLGFDFLRNLFCGASTWLKMGDMSAEDNGGMRYAGSRVWMDFTVLLNTEFGQFALPRGMASINPATSRYIQELIDSGIYAPIPLPTGRFKSRKLRLLRQVRAYAPGVPSTIMATIRNPDDARERFNSIIHGFEQQCIEETARIERHIGKEYRRGGKDGPIVDGWKVALAETITGIRNMKLTFGRHFLELIPTIIAGLVSLSRLGMLCLKYHVHDGFGGLDDDMAKSFSIFTAALPHNVTTAMDLALWDASRVILDDDESKVLFEQNDAHVLAERYQQGVMPETALNAINEFMDLYGSRGYKEVDFGRKRWREDPYRTMGTIKSYVAIPTDSPANPNAILAKSKEAVQSILDKLIQAVPWYKKPIVRKMWRVGSAVAGLRESPKFTVVKMMGTWRSALLKRADDLVKEGILGDPDDIFHLFLAELDELAGQLVNNNVDTDRWRTLIKQRHYEFARMDIVKQVPVVLLSDGRAYYPTFESNEDGTVLQGTGVSSGVVEGIARIVEDPTTSVLTGDDIMVCHGTDPAWTPLFLIVKGIIMELGGSLTHGAIVSREFGLPGVVGIHQVTKVIKDGQRVRIDGTSGVVTILQ